MTKTHKKSTFIRFGDFLFKYRNVLFPCVLVAIALIRPPAHSGALKQTIAIATVATGLAIRAFVIGFAYIKRGGLNKKVYADTLVTEGLFGLSRNPLYVGNLLVYIGVFLMHGDPLVVAIGVLTFVIFYLAIVAAEEFFLRQKFGDAYDAYTHDVPRWLPKLKGIRARFHAATDGMNYNVKRVILKDYSTMINALISLLFMTYYEALTDNMQSFDSATSRFAVYLLVLAALALAIRTYKKRGAKA